MKKNKSTTFQIIKCQIHLDLYLFHNQTEHMSEKQVDETTHITNNFSFFNFKEYSFNCNRFQ